ncbi:MAG TPA: response regulator [Roseiflexaceae bacterium]|nr:response regulator [Roseiflexaceae bacterium]
MPTILVIDDREEIAYSVRAAVPECDVLHAADGVEGLDVLRARPRSIDLILLDYDMPVMDGRDTCVRLRNVNQQVPIRFFTAVPSDTLFALGRELGCGDPLLKPLRIEQLREQILRTLGMPAPPMQPAGAVIAYMQELAAEREQQARARQSMRIVVHASSRMVQGGLSAMLAASGMRTSISLLQARQLSQLLPGTAYLLVVAPGDLSQTLDSAPEHPLLCIAATLREGLSAVDLLHGAHRPVGVVVDQPERHEQVAALIREVVQNLEQGHSHIPPQLAEPFAAADLTLAERKLLTLELRELDTQTIAARLVMGVDAVRQRRSRLAARLGIPVDELRSWAEQWWMDHYP